MIPVYQFCSFRGALSINLRNMRFPFLLSLFLFSFLYIFFPVLFVFLLLAYSILLFFFICFATFSFIYLFSLIWCSILGVVVSFIHTTDKCAKMHKPNTNYYLNSQITSAKISKSFATIQLYLLVLIV